MVRWQPDRRLSSLKITQKSDRSNLADRHNLTNKVNRQRAWVEIDLKALAHNVREIKAFLSPETALMAVVKADAYGHGAVIVAKTALEHGADWLAVATLTEGIELRQAGISCGILVLGAINSPEEIMEIVQWQLQPTICNSQQALTFSATLSHIQTMLPVHLKLDTGMSRLGTHWQNSLDFAKLVARLPYLEIKSFYSHLATADDSDRTTMLLQQQRFKNAIAEIKNGGLTSFCLHLANSAATLSDRSFHYDLVRVGLALYGLYPAPHLQEQIKLKPVLQVKARVTQVKTIPAGTGVSYSHNYISDREMSIAVVSIGYADGVARNLSNKLQAIIRGQLVPQIGTITMDQLMLDVSEIPNLQTGEIVTLLGKDGDRVISADDWANTLNTISWEVLCGFKHRLPRVIL
jgi:alanine racemase